MSDVVVYVYAPKRDRRGRPVRAVKVELVRQNEGGTYTPLETLVEGELPCPPDAADICFVIDGRVKVQV